MVNLSQEFCFKLRDARRSAGISQTVLAREVGCKQSAISMFEQGDGTKLNDEVILKLAKKFRLDPPVAKGGAAVFPPARPSIVAASGFCPNSACPSHTAYLVEGRRLLRPDLQQQDPVGGTYCAVCGEVLERRCPNCGAPVHAGAVCSHCGQPYVVIA